MPLTKALGNYIWTNIVGVHLPSAGMTCEISSRNKMAARKLPLILTAFFSLRIDPLHLKNSVKSSSNHSYVFIRFFSFFRLFDGDAWLTVAHTKKAYIKICSICDVCKVRI